MMERKYIKDVVVGGGLLMVLGVILYSTIISSWNWLGLVSLGGSLVIGIGSSILATAIVTLFVVQNENVRWVRNIVTNIVNKMDYKRVRQEAELIFYLENGFVKLEKSHRFYVKSPKFFPHRRLVSVFTDKSLADGICSKEFQLVVGPDNSSLTGKELEKFVNLKRGKYVFEKEFTLHPGDNNRFEFRSIQYYRLTDRVIWTVQELSDDFEISIKNRTDKNYEFAIKINHHCEDDIYLEMNKIGDSGDIHFAFHREVLPYQGFEIMWDLT